MMTEEEKRAVEKEVLEGLCWEIRLRRVGPGLIVGSRECCAEDYYYHLGQYDALNEILDKIKALLELVDE